MTKIQKHTIFFIAFLILITAGPVVAEVKKADFAGAWYPGSKGELSAALERYLKEAAPVRTEGEIIGIIVPHAGLMYSGPVAAYGYKAIEGMKVDTAVVIGFSHRRSYDGVAVFDLAGYETPLGTSIIDHGMTQLLIKQDKKIYSYPLAFKDENSVELQIPFLQRVLPDAKLVLIAIGDQTYENCQIIGRALADVLKDRENYLIVASTDMCHYLPYNAAYEIDKKTIAEIKKMDPHRLYTESLLKGHGLMCGYGAVCAAIIASKSLGADSLDVLKYATSGDTAGDKKSVVGYLSALIYKKNPDTREVNPNNKVNETKEEGAGQMLSEDQKSKLLQIARKTIEAYIETGVRPEFKEDSPALNREMGAFVTIHSKGSLRGCIGNIVGRGPLYLTVRDMAIEASSADPRFPPVTPSELKDIDIEISVLSELEKIDDPGVIEMGKHGVLVRKGLKSGVFLPQVAVETGWSKEEFMSNLCARKAGLPPDAWKTGKCDIYVFTAVVFGEKE